MDWEFTECNHNEGSRKEAILMLNSEEKANLRSIYRIIKRNQGIFSFSPSPAPSFSLHLLAWRNNHLSETSARVSTNGIRGSKRKALRVTTLRHSHSPRNSPPFSLNPAGFQWIIRSVLRITSLSARIRLYVPRIFASHIVLPSEKIW